MKYLVSLISLLSIGCKTKVVELPPSGDELHAVWESQVDDAVATLTAIRPGLDGNQYSLKMYDLTLDGLISLSGYPTTAAVESKVKLIELADPKVLQAIEKKNKELDRKTSELESKAKAAEERAKASEAKAEAADKRSRMNELSKWISIGGAAGAMIGFLAFVFVPATITPKWVSAAAVPMSVGIAVFGHRLLEWLGTAYAGYIIGGSACFVLVNALAYFAWKLWVNAKNRLPWPRKNIE